MSDHLSIGDSICLFCEDCSGYVYSLNTSSVFNNINIYRNQCRISPTNILDPQMVTFQIVIQNRYKLNQKFYKNYSPTDLDSGDHEVKFHAKLAKASAITENLDNDSEQKRNLGKKLCYGDIVQLKHMFSHKYLHLDSTQISLQDQNSMRMCLSEMNGKTAQFRIIPRYKVKSIGELVQLYDQVSFESMKSRGHYFHCSESHVEEDPELNLSVEQSSFTLVKFQDYLPERDILFRAGDYVQLFHKELEAYLVADEGEEVLLDEKNESENEGHLQTVRLRVREFNRLDSRTLRPSTSALSYWQVESELSVLHGDILRWEHQFRFRHAPSRMYLCVDEPGAVCLVKDSRDPRTVFKMQPVIPNTDEINYDGYVRIEHVLTKSWMTSLQKEHLPVPSRPSDGEKSMRTIRWDGGVLRKLSCIADRRYDDAYTLQKISREHVTIFNYVTGSVPYIKRLVRSKLKGITLSGVETYKICLALAELRDFMMVDGKPVKARQKLLRNLKVIDLIVQLLSQPFQGLPDERNMVQIHKACYDILCNYMTGSSRKNSLYFAKHIEMFQPKMSEKNELALKITKMIVELIHDKRKIVDRINQRNINEFINGLHIMQHSVFLELLEVLCVCNGVAIPENQIYIAEEWLLYDERSIYVLEKGQNIHRTYNVMYISTDCRRTWKEFKKFITRRESEYNEEQVSFLTKQLDLYKALCRGRNEHCINLITKQLNHVTYDEAFLSLQSDDLPSEIRAKFCELIIVLFVDVNQHVSVIEDTPLAVSYPSLGKRDIHKQFRSTEKLDHIQQQIFLELRRWSEKFLLENQQMVASDVDHNLLIEQVLHLLHYLIKFGVSGELEDLRKLIRPLLNLMDAKQDIPFRPKGPGTDYNSSEHKIVEKYKECERYEASVETSAIVEARLAAMELMQLILKVNERAEWLEFLSTFKDCYEDLQNSAQSKQLPGVLKPAISATFSYKDITNNRRLQKRRQKALKALFESLLREFREELAQILMDLTKYKYSNMVQKALSMLNFVYSSCEKCFNMAENSLILVTTESYKVHEKVTKLLPQIRLFLKTRWTDEQVRKMEEILEYLRQLCHLPRLPSVPHPVNQSILIRHNIVQICLSILSAEADENLPEMYATAECVFAKTLHVLRALLLDNASMQYTLYQNIETLLRVRLVIPELALTLREIFVNNQELCLKIQTKQLQKIVSMVAEHQEKAPELLSVLWNIVRVQSTGLALKRNQTLVMKYLMQNYTRIAYIADVTSDERLKILLGERGDSHKEYFLSLIYLMATCAEGENRYIESLCQTMLSIEDVFAILNQSAIHHEVKRPFLRFLTCAYIKSSTIYSTTGTMELLKDRCWNELWQFMTNLLTDTRELIRDLEKFSHMEVTFFLENPYPINGAEHVACVLCLGYPIQHLERVLKDRSFRPIIQEDYRRMHASIHYFLDSVLPFLQSFSSAMLEPQNEENGSEAQIMADVARAIVELFQVLSPKMMLPEQLKTMIGRLINIISKTSLPPQILESVVNGIGKGERLPNPIHDVKSKLHEKHTSEVVLNEHLKNFSHNCRLIYGGRNVVEDQLGLRGILREYTPLDGYDKLPLGEEFQQLVEHFLPPGWWKMKVKKPEHAYKSVKVLIDQLSTSAEQSHLRMSIISSSSQMPEEQEKLDFRCLQVLRAILHNTERRLPVDWGTRLSQSKVKKQLKFVSDIQSSFVSYEICSTILSHLANPCDVINREVLSLQSMLLFNANITVQKAVMDYFFGTREEVFFYAIRNRIQNCESSMRERRLLQLQHHARQSEAAKNAANLTSTMVLGRQALREIRSLEVHQANLGVERSLQQVKNSSSSSLSKLPRVDSSTLSRKSTNRGQNDKKSNIFEVDVTDLTPIGMEEEILRNGVQMDLLSVKVDDVVEEEVNVVELPIEDTKSDENIELVLRVLAQLCAGQNPELQNYLRFQPDNIKSYNLLAEVSNLINVFYNNVTNETIDLVINILSTINDFIVGNQENRITAFDHKAIDFVNFLIRSGEFPGCSLDKMLDLRQVVSNLVISFIEEDNPEATAIAKEVQLTLDQEAVYKVMTECYRLHESKQFDDVWLEKIYATGFRYYLILARMHDLSLEKNFQVLLSKRVEDEQKAYLYFQEQSLSVEILKDNYLQKVHFHARLRDGLREEVKEKLKWNVDRTSPSNKIQDFMDWSQAILTDINYQKRFERNYFVIYLTKGWLFWNYTVTLVSILINLFMAIGIVVPDPSGAFSNNHPYNEDLAIDLTEPFHNMTIVWDSDQRHLATGATVLSYMHNVLSVIILLSYLIADHPTVPEFFILIDKMNNVWKRMFKGNKLDERDEMQRISSSRIKMKTSLLSMKTIYILIFTGSSFAGSCYNLYFFTFHILHVVQTNRLLLGVISAVTRNGISLIWVSFLFLIIIYYYAIIIFAFFRSTFNAEYLFAETFWNTFFSVLRFGLLEDMFEKMVPSEGEEGFIRYSQCVLIHVSFFFIINTIGLNIIFGIIVDTFSELRDTKTFAEIDMRDECFICSRKNYEFEYRGVEFRHHVQHEHNMWSYLHYFMHLRTTKAEDYTSIDLHVATLLKQEKYDFFPLNRAICLKEEEEEDSTIDTILANIRELSERKQREDKENIRKKELVRQMRWKKKLRNRIFHQETGDHHHKAHEHDGDAPPENINLSPVASSSDLSDEMNDPTGLNTHIKFGRSTISPSPNKRFSAPLPSLSSERRSSLTHTSPPTIVRPTRDHIQEEDPTEPLVPRSPT